MTNLSEGKKTAINNVLTPALMSTDEECDDGFISHQPSWQSDKFKNYKEKLDNKFKDICSKKSKKMLKTRIIGEERNVEAPQLAEDQQWIIK